MSQHDLARELNVSFTSLNRWENKQVAPSKLAAKVSLTYPSLAIYPFRRKSLKKARKRSCYGTSSTRTSILFNSQLPIRFDYRNVGGKRDDTRTNSASEH
ncbi:MAG: helix-turn-helix domain-containing protein [Deltaproteobacteria bacterium]|nr:helix-turn-helix domain-containing protein [Deltaproteobacteria bacterium]